jgi:hypothetical protein
VHVVFTLLKDIPVSRDTPWIGWEPVAQQLRPWSGELSAGFGEGIWTKDGNQWIIKTTSTLRDGKQVSARLPVAAPCGHWPPKFRGKNLRTTSEVGVRLFLIVRICFERNGGKA